MKVAIVGAGINGLYLAWKLSEKNQEVTVFEKREKIGKEACSGLISERILEFIPQAQQLVENQITSCQIGFPRKTLEIKFGKRFLVIDHFSLDNLVANLARKKGVKIILNHNVKKEDIKNLSQQYERIIGTDGALSEVRKYLNLPEPKYRLGIQLYSYEEFKKSDTVNTWATESGFIWKIPRKEPIIEYGIIEEPEEAKIIFEDFLSKKNIPSKNLKSALIPCGLTTSKDSKITLCGDAAGLTKPWSGGGVVWGLIAANLLLRNFPNFIKYQKELKKFFLTKIIFSKAAAKTIYFFGFNFPWILPKKSKIDGDFLL